MGLAKMKGKVSRKAPVSGTKLGHHSELRARPHDSSIGQE